MEFLDVECDQRNIIRMTAKVRADRKLPRQKNRKNKNRPEAGGSSSWVETPLFQAGGHVCEDIGAKFSPIEEKRNDAKILGEHIFR